MTSFKIDMGLQIWTLLTFGGLLILLAKFAFKPLKKILAEREAFIKDTLEKARQANEAAAKLLDENRRQTEEAREAARRSITEGQARSDELLRKAHEEAREQTQTMIERARSEIDREVQRGMEDLKSTVADVSIKVARQVIKENLDERRHARLVEEFIDQLKKEHEQPVAQKK